MENNRTMTRMAMLCALVVLPSLASCQTTISTQRKVPDWSGKAVTQITIDGSSQQLKAFQAYLPAFIKKGLEDETIFHSPTRKNKLVYSYLTETEKKFDESNVFGFYSALKGSTEKTQAVKKPMVMSTSVYMILRCLPGPCAGQQAWKGPFPQCDCH